MPRLESYFSHLTIRDHNYRSDFVVRWIHKIPQIAIVKSANGKHCIHIISTYRDSESGHMSFSLNSVGTDSGNAVLVMRNDSVRPQDR